jgi:ribulose bisphosphate carboxylase small subunit
MKPVNTIRDQVRSKIGKLVIEACRKDHKQYFVRLLVDPNGKLSWQKSKEMCYFKNQGNMEGLITVGSGYEPCECESCLSGIKPENIKITEIDPDKISGWKLLISVTLDEISQGW